MTVDGGILWESSLIDETGAVDYSEEFTLGDSVVWYVEKVTLVVVQGDGHDTSSGARWDLQLAVGLEPEANSPLNSAALYSEERLDTLVSVDTNTGEEPGTTRELNVGAYVYGPQKLALEEVADNYGNNGQVRVRVYGRRVL